MKKGRFLLVLSCLTAIIGLVSCQPQTPTNPTKTPTVETPPVETTKYVVTFNTNGGSTLDSIEVIEGEKISKPTDPTREGYIFDNWYKDTYCKIPFNFESDKITSNTSLYASWVAKESYTITWTEVSGVTYESTDNLDLPVSGYTNDAVSFKLS